MRCRPGAQAQGPARHGTNDGELHRPALSESKAPHRAILFGLFFVSGFCGLVYQLVWTRMAFAAFGIITPVLSVVISVFMLGLSLGAWAGGKWIGQLTARTGLSAALYYALAEVIIGLGAVGVPKLFALGEHLLQAAGETNSLTYLSFSALVLALSILPWCLFMGATVPFMMAYLREREGGSPETFSFLYLANVLGATSGIAIAALALIEIFGFHDTLQVAAAGNFMIAAVSVKLGWDRRATPPAAATAPSDLPKPQPVAAAPLESRAGGFIKWVLFTTGFVAMAMEVVWTRAFAPVLKTQVYSFAMVVATYLAATFAGSWLYRRHLRHHRSRSAPELIALLCSTAFLPVLASEACFLTPKLGLSFDSALSIVILLASICPFCGILGYLTPALVDDFAAGSPAGAGTAYAINVLGCILGPVFASYVLLSQLSDRHALILLGLPFFGLYVLCREALPPRRRWGLGLAGIAVVGVALLFCRSFEQYVFSNDKNSLARRDYAASVVCTGQGLDKWLLVNGNSMTRLTPITKFMAHLPLAFHSGKPQSALVICFGMGTTYRSALSWDLETVAVELVPSVAEVFGFFFDDAAQWINHPKGRIVIDDGRRYLKRTAERFDVIIVDPPPPVEAAGSSLLYSREFYELARQHLKPGGIIQTWVPENLTVARAAARSLCDVFPQVRCFGSIQERGVHLLGSFEPIPPCTPAELAARMPAAAAKDLLEWSPSPDLPAYVRGVLSKEFGIDQLLDPSTQARITDDQPYNEYYLLRKLGWW